MDSKNVISKVDYVGDKLWLLLVNSKAAYGAALGTIAGVALQRWLPVATNIVLGIAVILAVFAVVAHYYEPDSNKVE